MKKLFGLLMIAGMMSFVACGPSAEELAKKAADSARVADSIAKVQADSIAAVAAEEQAKADAAAAEQAKADSIAAAEANKGKKK
jgi:hypothetical protein